MAENAIHFFTDQLLIETINNEYPFGCVVGKEHTEFNVTSIHKSKKPSSDVCYAYAAIDGQVFFQEDEKNSKLLNIALKPKKQHIIDGYTIKYFIYRGIQKNSLLNGDNIIDNTNSPQKEIDLLTKIWKAQIKLNHIKGTSNTPSKDIIGLGFTSTSTGGFANNPNDYIESFFYKTSDDFHTWDVKLGDSIGIYDNVSIGFEIVVGNYLPTIKDLRQPQTIISVADYNTLGDNATKFVNRVEREAILNYIDPCAFYGLFFNHKIKTIHGNKKTDELVEMLQQTYFNASNIYLDIRDRHNQSHSFYFNNFKTISITIDGNNIYTGESHTNYWPLIIINTKTININSPINNGIPLILEFQDVLVPSIAFHLAQGFYKTDYPKPRKKLIEVTTDTSNNTCTAELMLHAGNVQGTFILAPSIIKARYIIKVADSLPPDEFEIESQTYVDNLFKLNDIYDVNGNMIFPFNPTKTCYWRMLEEDVFVDEDSGYLGGYMAKVGYAKDDNGYYFFGFSSGDELRRSSIDPFLLSGESDDENFIDDVLRTHFDVFTIVKEEISATPKIEASDDDLKENIIESPRKAKPSNDNLFFFSFDIAEATTIAFATFNYTTPLRLSIIMDTANSTAIYMKEDLWINWFNSSIVKQETNTLINFYSIL